MDKNASRIILVTGGSRSGKSDWARRRAEAAPGPRLFLATAPALDDEMRARIHRHRAERHGRDWATIEEEIDLAGVLRRSRRHPTVLVDCLTLWAGNLLHAEAKNRPLTEDRMARLARDLAAAARRRGGMVVFVTNEVGFGLIPDNAIARRFRDVAGRMNQTLAAAADEVVLIACGIPLHLKENPA
ncbi:MAG: bifunctional adenosylcobinamide kinase/adenosylcobinamide-phosphate guanylyltransferase [Planctomycetota bacterium]